MIHRTHGRRRTRALGGIAALALGASLLGSAAQAAPGDRPISFTKWTQTRDFAGGTAAGVVASGGELRFERGLRQTRVAGRDYEWAMWTSPVARAGFAFTELVPSWVAATPGSSFIRLDVRGVRGDGSVTDWDRLARWARTDRAIRRSTYGAQTDGGSSVDFDVFKPGARVTGWQVRVLLFREVGKTATPRVEFIGGVASKLPAVREVTTSQPLGTALGTTLNVPGFSQMTHEGTYPRYDGGGEAWCSPTSTSMVLAHFQSLPEPNEYRWVRAESPDRFVPFAARQTYDVAYGGAGTWPFNTAYAGHYTDYAMVTRLRDLRDAERFIAAGIPLVVSVQFERGELSGAPISRTNGHLMVIVGFTRSGDVVVNDPAAPNNSSVRRTYARAQFENVWLRRYVSNGRTLGSGGLTYVIRDGAHALPPRGDSTSW